MRFKLKKRLTKGAVPWLQNKVDRLRNRYHSHRKQHPPPKTQTYNHRKYHLIEHKRSHEKAEQDANQIYRRLKFNTRIITKDGRACIYIRGGGK